MKNTVSIVFFLGIFNLTLVQAQNICDLEIHPVCSSETLDVEAPNSDFEGYIESCDGAIYQQQNVVWYHVRILEGSTFTFKLQIQHGDDYDFAVWLNPDCEDIGPADRATFIHEPDFDITETGLMLNETDECEGIGIDAHNIPGMVRHLDVQPWDDIFIMIYRPFGLANADFSVVFEDTGGDALLDCTILGNSYNKCDDDLDGKETFTENDFLSDLSTDYPTGIFRYFGTQEEAESGEGTELSFPMDVLLNSDPTEIFVRVEHPNGDLNRVVKIFLNVSSIPLLFPIEPIEKCDSENDHSEIFDLTEKESELVADISLYTFSYYNTQNFAELGGLEGQIQNPSNYPSGNDTVYVRVQTTQGCFRISEIQLKLNEVPELNSFENFIQFCADHQAGTQDYDLTELNYQLIDNPTDYLISYHTSQNDAETNSNPIVNFTAYPLNIGTQTTVYIRVQNDADCFVITSINLFASPKPVLEENLSIQICDDDFDGSFAYNLNDLSSELLTDTNNVNFNYYLTENDSENNLNPIPEAQLNSFVLATLPAQIWVVAHIDNCFSEAVEVQFEQKPSVNYQSGPYPPLKFCQDEFLDLTQNEAQIGNDLSFSYFTNLENAIDQSNAIQDPTAYETSGDGIIYVRLEDGINCPAILEIQYLELPLPIVDGIPESPVLLCEGDNLEIHATSDHPSDTFEWTWESGVYSGSDFTITEVGNYNLTVTNSDGCKTEKILTITLPAEPVITSIETGENFIIVHAESANGGDLEYSLNQILWQTDERFDNLTPGEVYTVYVRAYGCMISKYDVALIEVPNFISPNGDGYNETWEIRGIQVTPQATIKIFDRYGKLFVDTNFDGSYKWDGKYLGVALPASDYWYSIDVPTDGVVTARKFVGHITIKNK